LGGAGSGVVEQRAGALWLQPETTPYTYRPAGTTRYRSFVALAWPSVPPVKIVRMMGRIVEPDARFV
jgi:hypothetical protein